MDPPTCTTKTQTFRATSAAGEAPACLLERRFESEFSFNNCAADSGVPSMTKFGAEHSPAENERTRELGEHRPCRHAELTFARPRGNAFLLAPQTSANVPKIKRPSSNMPSDHVGARLQREEKEKETVPRNVHSMLDLWTVAFQLPVPATKRFSHRSIEEESPPPEHRATIRRTERITLHATCGPNKAKPIDTLVAEFNAASGATHAR
ncbi:hypothetical protein MRX96_023500 [Rhipicephalus microplus]